MEQYDFPELSAEEEAALIKLIEYYNADQCQS